MPSIGDSLREARMRQRLDIADVEVRTKIRAKYLRALENEEFDRLPGGTFAKTFLRTYAEVLGLDPQLLVEEYRAHHEHPDETEIQPFVPPQPGGGGGGAERRQRQPRRPPGRGVVIGAAVVALIGFLLILGLTGGDEDGGGPATEGTTGASTERAKRPKPRSAAAAAPVTIRISPSPDTTLQTCVYIDNGAGTKPVFQDVVEKPVVQRGKKFRVVLGNRSVELVVNRKPIDLGSEVGPAAFEFSRAPGQPLRGKAVPVDARPVCG